MKAKGSAFESPPAKRPPPPTSPTGTSTETFTDLPRWMEGKNSASEPPRKTGTTRPDVTRQVSQTPSSRPRRPPSMGDPEDAPTDAEPSGDDKRNWAKRRSLHAALIVGGCLGAVVALAQPSTRGLARSGNTAGQVVAVLIDVTIAFSITALVWGLVTYAIALRVNKRRVEKQGVLAVGAQKETHPGRWLAVGSALVLLSFFTGAAVSAANRNTMQIQARNEIPSITSTDHACYVFTTALEDLAERNETETYVWTVLGVIRDRSAFYPEFSRNISVVLDAATPTNEQKAAVIQTCIDDGHITLPEAQAWASRMDALG